MKIAFIALRGVPLSDGIVSYTDELATRLQKKGHDVTVYTSRRYGNKTGNYNNKYYIKTVMSLKNPALEKISLVFFASLNQIFKKYDIVHFHGIGIFSALAKLYNKKIVVQSHGIEYERAKWGGFAKKVLKWIEKKSYNKGNCLTVVSNALKAYYMHTYNKQAVYIPTAVNLPNIDNIDERFLDNFHLQSNDYFLFMARIVEEKGAHYLIDAFRQVKTKKKLVIAGNIDKNNPYHKKLLERAGQDERIMFVGNISGNNKSAMLKYAYAFCQPSEIEGLSVALLEAMSFKNCCIVSDIAMNTEAVGDTGIIFENKNVEDLKNKLEYAIDYPDFIKSKGLDAFARVKENYTWDIVTEKIEQLYKGLVIDGKIK